MKRSLLLLLITITLCIGALAHGDKKHVQGTVAKINADSIVVKGKGGSILVKIGPSTMFVQRIGKTDKSAQASDLGVGDLVVIHASPTETGLEADEVKFSKHRAAGGASSAKSKS